LRHHTPNIRPLAANDFAQWSDLWRQYLEFYQSSVPQTVYETTFDRLIDAKNTAQNALVADQAGTLVGLVHFIYHPHIWRVENVCYLQDLFTAPNTRGQGVGRALIQSVYDVADKNGTPSVYWLTQDFNKTARLLYDRIATQTPFIKYQR
jgi:GNAT superfamily N-acetyltransferase